MGVFFFNYLSLKWKRLIRSFFLLLCILHSIHNVWNVYFLGSSSWFPVEYIDGLIVLSTVILWLMIASWISFILNPFLIKKENKFPQKNILTSFTFGYLHLKWKRLVRSIFILLIIIEESSIYISDQTKSIIFKIDWREVELVMGVCVVVFIIISLAFSGFFMRRYKKEQQEFYDINDFK